MPETNLAHFFQELAMGYASVSMWQRKYAHILHRIQGAALQKISASDEGFLSLAVYKPGDDRSVVVCSIQKHGAGIQLEKAKPVSQPKPNAMVQLLRKYLQGRRIVSAWCSLKPMVVGFSFAPPSPESPDREALLEGPDSLILDLDCRPARICLTKHHKDVPNRYGHVGHAFKGTEIPFLESFCEWSLDSTKTKHRATFEHPLATLSFLPATAPKISSEETNSAQPESKIAADVGARDHSSENALSSQEMSLTRAFCHLPPHVRRAAKTRYQFLERRLSRQKEDFPPESDINRLTKRAQGLQIYLHLWPKGSHTWYVPADIISDYALPAFFKLKPGQKPGDLVEEAFHELERTKRRQQELQTRIAQSENALASFSHTVIEAALEIETQLLTFISDNAISPNLLDKHIAQNSYRIKSDNAFKLCHMCDVEWLTSGEKKKQANKAVEQRLPYRTYRSFTGEFIRIAKSSVDADAMLKMMPANHTWLHILTGEGSHVWLERPRGSKPTPRAIREAAILAIHFSKQSRTMAGEVRIATRADIERKKNLAPGKVLIRRCETMMCKYNDNELQRVLATTNEKNNSND